MSLESFRQLKKSYFFLLDSSRDYKASQNPTIVCNATLSAGCLK